MPNTFHVNMIDVDRSGQGEPLGYLLRRAINTLRADVTATVVDPLGVAFPEYLCMRVLARSPGHSNADLARDLNVSPQAMNQVLLALEERGLVTRPADMSAGRALPARLTRAGYELLECVDAGVRAVEDRLMASLSERERRDFTRMLAVLGSDGL